jgi:hypothetical protein
LAAPIISPIITHLINHSFTTCTFPNNWKKARVTPIFKAGDPAEPGNYRPISILPVISKVIERVVFDQLYKYLNDNNLIYVNQSGFRPSFSTATALINISEDWYNEIDNGNIIGLCMLDLKKAFDTVNHNILLDKLKLYGVSKYVTNWFNSYLSNRTQFTCVDGISSDLKDILCGLPQGSIDGPLGFLIYINDLPKLVSHSKVSMYADDTALYYASSSVDDIVKCMNEDLVSVNNWLKCNKLSLNVDKSEFMFIASRQRLATLDNLNLTVQINGENIRKVDKCKHLGVIIDKNLTC